MKTITLFEKIRTIGGGKLLLNFGIHTISTIFSQLIGMIALIIITRNIGPRNYGEYAMFITLSSIFLVVSSFGIRNIVIRRISRNIESTRQTFLSSIYTRLIGVFLATGLLLLYNAIFYHRILNRLDLLLLSYVLLLGIWDSLENVIIGHKKTGVLGLFNFLFNLLWLAIIIYLEQSKLSMYNLVIIQIFILVFKDIFLFIYSIRENMYLGDFAANQKKEIFKLCTDSRDYYVLFLFGLVITNLPGIFLGLNSDFQEVGYFSASNKILGPMGIVFSSALLIIYPYLASLFSNSIAEFEKRIYQLTSLFFIFGGLFAFLFSIFSEELVLLMFGRDFVISRKVFIYQVWFFALNSGILSLYGNIFGAINKEIILRKIMIISAVVGAPIFWFCSKLGAETLSLSFVVFAFIQLFYTWIFIKKYFVNLNANYFVICNLFILTLFGVSIFISYYLSFHSKFVILIMFTCVIISKMGQLKKLFLGENSIFSNSR
jgi:O-antigen/teichoic acid export membrane protein